MWTILFTAPPLQLLTIETPPGVGSPTRGHPDVLSHGLARDTGKWGKAPWHTMSGWGIHPYLSKQSGKTKFQHVEEFHFKGVIVEYVAAVKSLESLGRLEPSPRHMSLRSGLKAGSSQCHTGPHPRWSSCRYIKFADWLWLMLANISLFLVSSRLRSSMKYCEKNASG